MLHVPYKGPTARRDRPDRRPRFARWSTSTAPPRFLTFEAGRLRALGVSTASADAASYARHSHDRRDRTLPGYESAAWFGLMAPAGTPKEVIARLHKEIVAILRAPDIRERFARDGAEVVASSPEEFDAYMRAEAIKWAKVVKRAGIKPE